MNYIKKLEEENRSLTAQLDVLQGWRLDVIRYLISDKFKGFENQYVNKQDILLRLDELQGDLLAVECMDFSDSCRNAVEIFNEN